MDFGNFRVFREGLSIQRHLNKDLNGKGSGTRTGEGAIMKVLQQKEALYIGMD